jgi:hypothetical protein
MAAHLEASAAEIKRSGQPAGLGSRDFSNSFNGLWIEN